MRALASLLKWLERALILYYKTFFSGIVPSRCIFTPSCSQYALDALEKYGFFEANLKIVWRILRCNPWNEGGHDPA